MKVAAILFFACIAVSQAAFTRNLVNEAKPLLSQALFKVRLASRSDIQTPLVQQLQDHANELLEQIQNAVSTGQQIAGSVVAQLQDTYAQLQALGSSVVENGHGILSNLFGSIWGSLFGNGKSLSAIVDFVQNFDVSAVIQNLLTQAQNYVSQLDLQQLLQSALGNLFGRGFFSDVWSQVSAAGSQAWSSISQVFNNIVSVAGNAFNQVQAFAQAFVTEASTEIQSITQEAATELLNFLRPYQQDLGTLYDQVVAQIGNLVQL